jgi:hypothetical protein
MKFHFSFILLQHLALFILFNGAVYLNGCMDENAKLNHIDNIQPNQPPNRTFSYYNATCCCSKTWDAKIKGSICAVFYLNKRFKAVKNAREP